MPKKPSDPPKRIMLVDDHPLVRHGLATLLRAEADLAVFADVGNADEALRLLEKDVPDLLLLDLSLPDVNGLELLKDLHIRYPNLRVLVLSMHEESDYSERVLRAGGHGYIMKQEPGSKVLEAIRCVLGGALYVSPVMSERLLKRLFSNKPGNGTSPGTENLSDRELQVYAETGRGRSPRAIADQLHLSVKTVQTHREHIKRKLGLRNAMELVHSATHWVEYNVVPS